jgi:hypothetical protein
MSRIDINDVVVIIACKGILFFPLLETSFTSLMGKKLLVLEG